MKYQGSKRRIVKEILPIILNGMKEGDCFVDAFCGGCNLLDKVPSTFKRIANYKNKYLIAMWARLTRYNWQPPIQIDRDIYNTYRAEFNKRKFNDNSSISFL